MGDGRLGLRLAVLNVNDRRNCEILGAEPWDSVVYPCFQPKSFYPHFL